MYLIRINEGLFRFEVGPLSYPMLFNEWFYEESY